jgi:hypothetical protein
VNRSAAIIGVLRLASQNTKGNCTRGPSLKEMIAQRFGGISGQRRRIAQSVSGIERLRFAISFVLPWSKRASASRQSRDAVHALATGRVALSWEVPSQGRRSLSRFPASGPQGFWPVELNLQIRSE